MFFELSVQYVSGQADSFPWSISLDRGLNSVIKIIGDFTADYNGSCNICHYDTLMRK